MLQSSLTYIYSGKVRLTVSGISDDVIRTREGREESKKGRGRVSMKTLLDLDSF